MLYLYLIHNPSGFISKLGHSFHETETSIIMIYILLLLFSEVLKLLCFSKTKESFENIRANSDGSYSFRDAIA